MKTTVRFIEDDEGYVAGDFGDEGEQTMAQIASGDLMVVGMVVFDADAVQQEVDDTGIAFETAVHHHTSDSLWCIVVPRAAIDDCDKDITDPQVIQDEYLRSLAVEHLLVTVARDDLALVVQNWSWPGPFSDDVEAAYDRIKQKVG